MLRRIVSRAGAFSAVASALLCSNVADAERSPAMQGRGVPNNGCLGISNGGQFNVCTTRQTLVVPVDIWPDRLNPFQARVRGNGSASTGCAGRWVDDNGSATDSNYYSTTSTSWTTLPLTQSLHVGSGAVIIYCYVAPVSGPYSNGGVLWVNYGI
jgi:hypothetical protein